MFLVVSVLRAVADVNADEGIPMRFQEGLLWVDVRVPHADKPLQFVLDTGAEVSVVNAETARNLGLKLGRKVTVSGVHTSITGHWQQKWGGEVGDIGLPERCLVLNLSDLATACSNRVDGLIGADFFRNRIVRLDYKKQRLWILDPKTKFNSLAGIPLGIGSHGMTIKARVDDSKAASVRLDTGCASALEWVVKSGGIQSASSRVAVGLSPISIPQSIGRVNIGKHAFEAVRIGLHARPIFPGEAGLIGNGILSLFDSVTVDSVHGRIFLVSSTD